LVTILTTLHSSFTIALWCVDVCNVVSQACAFG
jgi:hypothetical protein